MLNDDKQPPVQKEVTQQVGVGNSNQKPKPTSQRTRSASQNKAISGQAKSTGFKDNYKSDQNVPQARQTQFERQLSSQYNGMGLWIHQTKNQNENLPPIVNRNKPPTQQKQVVNNITSDIDAKVEKSLVGVLEKKYQDVANKLDQAELVKQNAVFECDLAKKEKQKFIDMYNQQTFDLTTAQNKLINTESLVLQLQKQVQELQHQNQTIQYQFEQRQEQVDQFKQMYQQEQQQRQQETIQMNKRINELEEQLGEYEEENMNLQNHIYQLKVQNNENNQKKQKSPLQDQSALEQESQQDKSTVDEQQNDENSKRIHELMSDLISLRKRLKKEEETKKQYQDIARKKDEEFKKIKNEFQILEKKLQEEQELKNREKNIVMQRDNKIKVLEDKVRQLGTENEHLKKLAPSKGALKKNNSKPKEEVRDKVVKFKECDNMKPANNKPIKQVHKELIDSDEEDEELQPVKAKPFLFGPIDNM